MSHKFSRRDALRYAGWGALALGQARLLHACGGPSGRDFEAPTLDPSKPWYLQGPFEPVQDEHESLALQVSGEIPAALSGLYVRNGSNPKFDRGSFFIGDGMLHGVRLERGRALWYRNRFVRTPYLGTEQSKISTVLRPTENASNVSVLQHAGKLLSLGEVGLPFEISPTDLSTIGPYDFQGRLKTFMTAHPKIDPRTGDLHMFGYGLGPPYLTYHHVNAAGELVRSEAITLPRSVLVHDLQITATRAIFMQFPVVFDVALGARGTPFPFRWEPSAASRIGVMPLGGGDADVTWFEVDACYVFHGVNAYDDAQGRVVLEVCRYPHMFRSSAMDLSAQPQLHRYTLDPQTMSAKLELLHDRSVEMPRLDPRRIGLDYRYHYGVWADTLDPTARIGQFGLIKRDRARDSLTVREFPEHLLPWEPLFVPARADAEEDEGFLLTFVLDRRTNLSSLDIYDARNLTGRALASVRLPWRVPLGLHGTWVPS